MRGEGNSLNNRFLPFSNIETDAVLSFDDDVCPKTKDIVNGFRLACPLNSSVHTYHRDNHVTRCIHVRTECRDFVGSEGIG